MRRLRVGETPVNGMRYYEPDFAPKRDLRMVALGAAVRRLREDRELTQEKLGEAVGLGRASIANIEKGDQNILASDLPLFCRALDVSADELLGLVEPKKDAKRADWRARAKRAEDALRAVRRALVATDRQGSDGRTK